MLKQLIDSFLDLTIVYSFDRTGFQRHCPEPLPIINLTNRHGLITGASSGIGLACAKALISQGMHCQLIARDFSKSLESLRDVQVAPQCHVIDMTRLHDVYHFVQQQVQTPIDLLIHNAGSMPETLVITEEGYEQMFASQVLAPFILTKLLADQGKLTKGCRVIFVSSGGMYLKKLDLDDLRFEKSAYNKYNGYANAKRAQVMLAELFSRHYPQYLFSAMHPGWAETPGVRTSMPQFARLIGKRLRTAEEGADTILWLATNPDYDSGKLWFDRRQVPSNLLGLFKSSDEDAQRLWSYCLSIYDSIKEV